MSVVQGHMRSQQVLLCKNRLRCVCLLAAGSTCHHWHCLHLVALPNPWAGNRDGVCGPWEDKDALVGCSDRPSGLLIDEEKIIFLLEVQ